MYLHPLALEEQMAQAAGALHKGIVARRLGGWSEEDDNPLAPFRRLTRRETFEELAELPGGMPNGDSLRRWLACLILERVTWEDRVGTEVSRRAAEHVVAGLGEDRWSLRALALETARAAHEGRRGQAAEGLARRARQASQEAVWWLCRRHAAALHLGLDSLSWLEGPWRQVSTQRASEIVFDRSDALALEMLDRVSTWHGALWLGAAMDAREGWPAQLTPRWFRTVFGGWKPLERARVDVGPLPEPICGASFTRAVFHFGTAVHRACAVRTGSPFSLAQRPFDASAAAYGALFAGLLASEPFLQRRLGLGKDAARAQARSMAISMLVAVRLDAARAILSTQTDAEGAVEAHARWASKALGSGMPEELAGVLPRYDPRAPARLAGALHAARLQRQLVETYDEDWFDNPRAHEYVTSLDVTQRLTLDEQAIDEGAKRMGESLAC